RLLADVRRAGRGRHLPADIKTDETEESDGQAGHYSEDRADNSPAINLSFPESPDDPGTDKRGADAENEQAGPGEKIAQGRWPEEDLRTNERGNHHEKSDPEEPVRSARHDAAVLNKANWV